jgi:hypothetical protein
MKKTKMSDAEFQALKESLYEPEIPDEPKKQKKQRFVIAAVAPTKPAAAEIPNYERLISAVDEQIENERRNYTDASGNHRAEAYKTVAGLQKQKKELEQRWKNEIQLEKKYKAKFMASSFGTEQDFSRIWKSRLRDEALLEAAGLSPNGKSQQQTAASLKRAFGVLEW